jgi:hypothetical protein
VDDLVDHPALGPLCITTIAARRALSLTLHWTLHEVS